MDDDELSDDEITHPGRATLRAIHPVARTLRDGLDDAATLNPIVNAGTLISGQKASRRGASGWDRFWAAVAIVPFGKLAHSIEALPRFGAMGTDLEAQIANWLGRKGATVITDANRLEKKIPGIGKTIFDGQIGKTLYEVKSNLRIEPDKVKSNIDQFTKQRDIAKRLGLNYRIFVKGGVPSVYRKEFERLGVRIVLMK